MKFHVEGTFKRRALRLSDTYLQCVQRKMGVKLDQLDCLKQAFKMTEYGK
ncbi:hypothetical protein QFZ81_003737 [Paenibacillus sp. V4I9]|nr:hypothetical protein [Paenibacillus sp. V4I9]